MILFRKWAKNKVKSYIYCVNQLLREKLHEKWNQECKQKQFFFFFFFNVGNIFHLLTSRTLKISWWTPVFKADFYIFFYNEQLRKIWRNLIDKFLLYHTSLRVSWDVQIHFLLSTSNAFWNPWCFETCLFLIYNFLQGVNDKTRYYTSFLRNIKQICHVFLFDIRNNSPGVSNTPKQSWILLYQWWFACSDLRAREMSLRARSYM